MAIMMQKYARTQLAIVLVVNILTRSLMASPTNLYPMNAISSKNRGDAASR